MITADDANNISEKKNLSQNFSEQIQEEIDWINSWIEVSAQYGKNESTWFVPKSLDDNHVKEIIKSFKLRGFEVVDVNGMGLRMWKFLW
jgi:hypothetical protein